MFNSNYGQNKRMDKNTVDSRNFDYGIFLFTGFAIIVFIFNILTYPNYLKYGEAIESVDVNSNGVITVNFTNRVAGYKIEDDREMIAWSNLFNDQFKMNRNQSKVLNPGGKRIPTTLLFISDGELDRNIFGEPYAEEGAGQITLPKLFIGMSLYMGFGILIATILLIRLFHRYPRLKKLLNSIRMVILSFILSIFLIKGISTSSYNLFRDMILIGIMTIPLFIIQVKLSGLKEETQ